MDTFTKLFGSLVCFVYHCFDRIVILGHLPLLSRPENIVHFFRNVHQVGAITKEVLRQRTDDYTRWVDSFARNHRIPVEWAQKGVRKEDYVLPRLRQMERSRRFGVYFILKSMEIGPSFRIANPKYPTQDPNYRIIAPQKSRYTHIYFYIRDEVVGPMVMCVGTFLPFRISYWLNGHSFIERELRRENVRFRKDDNAFLAAADPEALQAAADRLSAGIIRKRLDYWTLLVGPKFSKKDRDAINLSRHYSIQQVEYCRNLIFRKNFPIHKLYERSCDIGFEAEALNVHVDFPLFQRLALPIVVGRTKVPGIKIHDTRMMRLMEVLLHAGTKIGGWRTPEIRQAILTTFSIQPTAYSLNQVRYDLRKLRAHGLIERDGKRYAYRLTDKGNKVALLFVLFHKRVCGPLANSLFNQPPHSELPPATRIEAAYRRADKSIKQVIDLLAA